jgi:hypothetical protein
MSLAGSSPRITDSAGADLDGKKLRLFERLFGFPSIAAWLLGGTELTETVLAHLLGTTSRSKLELRREAVEAVPKRFVVEVFVRGFVNFVGGLRGTSADCVLPMLEGAM